MATTAATSTCVSAMILPSRSSGAMKLDGEVTNYGDWRDDLNRDGYAVIKGAIPKTRAGEYSDKFYSYIEDFGLGYSRHDPSTVRKEKLPVLNEKGMILHYGVTHEKWVWDIRSEPGVVEAFERVYDDTDLIFLRCC
ncbi:uncharacterized protein A1O9_11669 [Exophiala aquamarina CBS 119918]|uniref:Uncharacterized protein n=1 Tax=Exophiala aquamarina CBS 119918 TaxID=1182545 RepID=A0A072NZG9_9EURO|nr:uncharacterized protein A1O9_11669 [Exophiala aquamarina CBS 119918]KEF52428.1 hypothetical protein A1O9_11669 [Exophiala aquamarina CBS 119918]